MCLEAAQFISEKWMQIPYLYSNNNKINVTSNNTVLVEKFQKYL